MTAAAPRGPTTRELLKMQWSHPTYAVTAEAPRGGTYVAAAREALSREDAIKAIAGKDPRPLLVLRECTICNKTDDALLSPGADNERTIYLARWFHCVKLPVDVIEPDHPFNALFPDNDAEHLFVSAVDGSEKIPLESDTSRTQLWSAMGKALAAAYVKDPAEAFGLTRKVLDKIDLLDVKLDELKKKQADRMETPGMDASKVRKVAAEIEGVEKEIASRKEEIEELSKIDLKPAPAPVPAAGK